jgi:hypothetical protein
MKNQDCGLEDPQRTGTNTENHVRYIHSIVTSVPDPEPDLDLPDPDPFVRGTDPDPPVIKQK